MKTKTLPTQAEIKELLHYDPQTGIFRWRAARPRGPVKPWDVAGTLRNGYIVINVKNNRYYAHRLAWSYMTGACPRNDTDHIDGVRSNNAWANLREATRKQNMENQSLKKNNTSGFRGVTFNKSTKKWRAKVVNSGKYIHLGYFKTAEAAAQAAAAKRAEIFTHDTAR